MLIDHGSQFYINEKKNSERDVSRFEKKLVELGIKHILARIRHPETNGKLERFRYEIEQNLKSFEDESASSIIRDFNPGEHVGNPFYTTGTTDAMIGGLA